MARVILAMSGGVDSSVAAHLLKDAGHEVIGVFMRHGEAVESRCDAGDTENTPQSRSLPIVSRAKQHGCCTSEDAADARRIAHNLDIPFYALDLQTDFHRIIDYFVDEYAQGRTPNPCVVCNHWIKFGRLFDYADSLDAEFVATGHYAQLVAKRSITTLQRGIDADKDQSYVLFGIPAKRLERMLLPVGGFTKPEIRKSAYSLGLDVAQKPDSQEICFVSPGQHAQFVAKQLEPNEQHRGQRHGDIVTVDGHTVGRHEGIERFTVGQRKGLGVAMGEPRYVVHIDAPTRKVVIGSHEALACHSLRADGANWFSSVPTEPFDCQVQIRYNSTANKARVTPLDEKNFSVQFEQPCYGVSPGQAAVCYQGPQVLGGGWIRDTN